MYSLQEYPNLVEPNFDRPISQVYSVSDLTAYIRAVLESNENLINVWVSGEISNLSRPSSGHIYFTLKDSGASLRCVIWRDKARYLTGALQDGLAVEARGSVSVYEQGGQYQLYVNALRAAGEGRLYQEYLRLKARLESEGLFDEARKRPIPRFPRLIGMVTSPTGAALQDMLNTLRERCPLVEVVISPAAVQGDAAPGQIVNALEALNQNIHPDVIILARGGGSLEDLWAFNDERVVRAVAASPAPVISGVGHETDFTLTDFAADLRAPTPTGAAVAAVPDILELHAELEAMGLQLDQDASRSLDVNRGLLQEAAHRLERVSPRWQIMQDAQHLDELSMRMAAGMKNYLRSESALLTAAELRLRALDPRRIIERGYALVSDSEGNLVTSIQQVQLDAKVDIRLKDGRFSAQVKNNEEKK